MSSGIVATQAGIDVANAAEYQKIFDSRRFYMTVDAVHRGLVVEYPAITVSNDTTEEYLVIKHGLGFIPLFQAGTRTEPVPAGGVSGGLELRANKEDIFIRRRLWADSFVAATIYINLIIFNIDAEGSHTAPGDSVVPFKPNKSRYGVQVRDGDRPNTVPIVDTADNVLALQKIANQYVNKGAGLRADLSSVNVSTDKFTVSSQSISDDYLKEFYNSDWLTTGAAMAFFFNIDLPSPLNTEDIYYIIRTDENKIQLAVSEANALAGTQINIVDSGSLSPWAATGADDIAATDYARLDTIQFESDYFPSTMLAEFDYSSDGSNSVGPLNYSDAAPFLRKIEGNRMAIEYLLERASGQYVYVILNDPTEAI